MGARRSSPLQQIQATAWRAEYTSELIDLLHVLGLLANLETEQAELLARIVDGPTITVDELTEAHVLPVPAEARKPPKAHIAIDSVREFWLLPAQGMFNLVPCAGPHDNPDNFTKTQTRGDSACLERRELARAHVDQGAEYRPDDFRADSLDRQGVLALWHGRRPCGGMPPGVRMRG